MRGGAAATARRCIFCRRAGSIPVLVTDLFLCFVCDILKLVVLDLPGPSVVVLHVSLSGHGEVRTLYISINFFHFHVGSRPLLFLVTKR